MKQSSSTLSDHAKWMKLGMKANLFPYYNKFRRRIFEYSGIKPDSIILDFGCGAGLMEVFIKKYNYQFGKITGVDVGRELIEIAGNNTKDDQTIEFILIDKCGKLPFEDNTFDIIISSLVFHLLNKNQKRTALNELFRVLKPGGKVLFAEIGKPYNLFGRWAKFLTLNLWTKIWSYESNSADSFEGRLPDFILSAGFNNLNTLGRIKGNIYFISCNK